MVHLAKLFVYDGNTLLQERDDIGTVEAEYTSIPAAYGQPVSQHRDAESHFYLPNGVHDIVQLTDAGGTVTDEYRFDAWGNTLANTGSTMNPYHYKGQLGYYRDPDLAAEESSFYLHHRHLDPTTGRFRSQDPAEDDLNSYRYVKNNPVNEGDPSGLEEIPRGTLSGIVNRRLLELEPGRLELKLQLAIRNGYDIRYHGDGQYIVSYPDGRNELLVGPNSIPELQSQIANANSRTAAFRSVDQMVPDIPEHVVNRLEGVRGTAGAAAELLIAVPLLIAPEPVATKAGAGAIAIIAIDQGKASIQQIVTGESVRTGLNMATAAAGEHVLQLTPEQAQAGADVTELIVGFAGPPSAQRFGRIADEARNVQRLSGYNGFTSPSLGGKSPRRVKVRIVGAADELVAPSNELVLNSARREAWRSSFGQPSEGLGQLVRDLPKGHEARQELARMILEIRASGGAVANRGLTGGTYARFSGVAGGKTGLFQYQPSKLRIADFLEEQVHWQQIQSGQHLRTYGTQSTVDVLEILAKQRVLQHPEVTPAIKMEWLDDLARVRAGKYGQ